MGHVLVLYGTYKEQRKHCEGDGKDQADLSNLNAGCNSSWASLISSNGSC